MDIAKTLALLQTGNLDVEGLLPWSSNYTFLVQICDEAHTVQAVYKPRRGERPLWDFTQGTLCLRERAAFLVSDALGWQLVPPTVLRQGPNGLGSVQLFVEHDPNRHYFTFEGERQYRPQLQQIVLFDILINNADRKSGHVLLEETASQPRLWCIDHGICFHSEYKLRTVIWEFAGQPVPAQLLQDLRQFQKRLLSDQDTLSHQLQELLSPAEFGAMRRRLDGVIRQGVFREPGAGRHYPWPPV